MDSDPDVLIAITGTVVQSPAIQLLDLNWCTFDITTGEVTDEVSVFIKPEEEISIGDDLTQITGIEQGDLDDAEGLDAALKKLNTFMHEEIIMNNKAFNLVTVGDEFLTSFLPKICTHAGIKLAPHFSIFIDLFKFFPGKMNIREIVDTLDLKETIVRVKSQGECKTIIRIVNRLLKEGIKLTAKDTPAPVITRRSRSRSRSPTYKMPKTVSNVIRVKGLPFTTDANDVADFLYGISISQCLGTVDSWGTTTGEYIVNCTSEFDAREALAMTDRQFENNTVTVVESCQLAYDLEILNQHAKTDQKPHYVKIKGIDITLSVERFMEIFKAHQAQQLKLVDNSGIMYAVFDENETAVASLQLNGTQISGMTLEAVL